MKVPRFQYPLPSGTVKQAASTFPEHSLLIQPLYIFILLVGGILLRFPVSTSREYIMLYGIGTFSQEKNCLRELMSQGLY